MVLSSISNTITQKMGFFSIAKNNENEKINEFVVNKYLQNADIETAMSFKDEIKNGLES